MFSLKWIGHWALVAVAITAGCGQSIPAKPPRPVNPAYQGGPTKEGTLDTSSQTVEQKIVPLLEKAGWKAAMSDIGSTEGAIEVEGKKGERVEIRYESRGEKQTSISIKGTSKTPQAAVDGLYEKIQKGNS